MYASTREFVAALERAGELRTVRVEVDPVLEISRIADVVSKCKAIGRPSASATRTDPRFHDAGGAALLFEHVKGSKFPVLINALGSYRRMEMALGCEAGGFEAIGRRIASLVKPEPPKSLGEMLAKARQLLPLLRIGPKRRGGSGACQEFVLTGEGVDLTTLPLLRCWPMDGDFASLGYPAGVNDGIDGIECGTTSNSSSTQAPIGHWNERFRGRYITLGGIHTIHADDRNERKPSSHNIGMYRAQLLGRQTLAMHWHMHHDGARHWRSWKKLGKPMPVAIALGGESIMAYAATAPLPPGISELLLAGFLNGGGIRMVRGKTVPLWVPSNAEIVIEGWVSDEAGLIGWDPRDGTPLGKGGVFEGPFGDHTGFYSMPDRYPILRVSAITHRRDAIYPTTIVGLPPQEDYYLGKATERVFLPLLKTVVHDIEDYDLPMFGAFHNCACVKIRKAYPTQARRVMHSVWGTGQMAWTKTVLVVDDDVDVHDLRAVLRAAAQWCEPGRDVECAMGPVDILDHAAARLGVGMKLGFDCTRKIEGEQLNGLGLTGRGVLSEEAGARLEAAVRTIEGVCDARVHEGAWLIVTARKTKAGDGARVVENIRQIAAGDGGSAAVELAKFVIVAGQGVDAKNIDQSLFHWCANTDASRDMVRLVVNGQHTIAFDATPKVPGDERNHQGVREWPPILTMSDDVIANVDRRWAEYGLGDLVRGKEVV